MSYLLMHGCFGNRFRTTSVDVGLVLAILFVNILFAKTYNETNYSNNVRD